jgi:signal transduction histidine kinase
MFKSVKSKFISFTLILILLGVGGPTTFLILQFRENFRQRSVVMLETTMEVMYNGLNSVMMLGNQKNIQHILDNLAKNKNVHHIRIFRKDGTIRYSSDSTEVGKKVWTVSPDHLELRDQREHKMFLLNSDHMAYTLFQPIINEPRCQSCHGTSPNIGFLDIDTELTPAESNFFTGSVHIIFLGLVTAAILVLGIYFIFCKYVNKPLISFTKALEKVQRGDLEPQFQEARNDEFGIIQNHFDNMVSQLKESSQEIEKLHFEQLKRADKMVTLGELAAEMAHEINNPVGVIQSQADYLTLEMSRKTDLKEYSEEINTIMSHVEKIARITRNILRYSKKLPTDFHEFDVTKTIDGVIEILEPRLERKGVQVTKDISQRPVKLFGDPLQIEQVLTNLINNSIDAMEEGGLLNIALKKNADSGFCLILEDTGIGMDEQTKENIFTPFFTTKTDTRGTGLGLYIVRNICKNHNAEVQCESTQGVGTKFIITFKGNNFEKNPDRG